MSTTIDQKVLEMRFDNKQFEENVSESISTLDKLKGALNFDKVSDAFGSITRAAGKVDFSPVSNGIETIVVKFNALEVAAVQAISNIINNGIDKLQTAVNSLTIDQVSEGWQKFNDKTESVQTIMAATGKDIEEVNAQLERLNWFSDETSYSFTDMTSNVGKFTSVGVELDTAVTAMQGISTWAALSGANVNEASRAMYNLSQAMGVGAVKLMDWRSIENAGMATSEFKETVLDTAAAMGTLRKYTDGTYQTLEGTTVSVKNFNSTLAEGWFSSEVLLESLDAYGGFANELGQVIEECDGNINDWINAIDTFKDGNVDLGDLIRDTEMSADQLIPIIQRLANEEYELGLKAFKAAQESKTFSDSIEATKDAVSTQWMNSFELLFGDYEEAKRFFTEITKILYDLFGLSGEVRNEILEQWAGDNHSFAELFRGGVLDALWGVAEGIESLKIAFQEIFPEATVENTVKVLQNVTVKFSDFANHFRIAANEFELGSTVITRLRSVFDGFGAVLDIVKQAFSALAPAFEWVKNTAVSLADIILTLSAHFGEWLVNLSKTIRENQTFIKIVNEIGSVISPVTNKITEFINKIQTKLNTEGYNVFSDTLGKIGERLEPIGKFLEDIYTKVKQFFTDINFSDTLGSVWNFVKNIADTIWNLVKGIDLKGIGNTILDVLRSIGTGIKNIFTHFNIGQFLTDLGTGITNLLNSLGKGDFSNIFQLLTKGSLIYGGFNLGSLFGSGSDALKNLAGGEGGFLERLLSPVTGVFDQLKETIGSFTKDTDDGKLKSIAIAIGILAAALIGLSTIPSDKIDTALLGLGGALAGLSGEMKYLSTLSLDKSQTKGLKSVGLAMIEIAAAVAIMVWALKPLAEMDVGGLAKAGAGMVAIMGTMTAFIAIFAKISKANMTGVTDPKKGFFSLFQKSNGFDKQMIKVAEAMILIGAAMKIFASAMKDIGSLNMADWAQGIGGITIVMAEMVGFIAIVSKLDTSGIMKTALAMVVLGAAMKIFASAISDMGTMDFNAALQGLGLMTAVIVEMLAFAIVGSKIQGSAGHIAGLAASMIVLGIAMKTFASAMHSFAEMEPVQWINAIAQMGIVFAGMLTFIVVANAVAAQAGQIVVIAAAMIVLGIAMQSFAAAAKDFSGVNWTDLGKMGASMAGFVAILTAMGLLVGPLGAAVTILTGIGVALMAIGAGLTLIGIGLAAINIGLLTGQLSMMTEELRALMREMRGSIILDNIIKIIQVIPQAITGVISGIIAGIISGLGMIISSFGDLIKGFTDLVLAFLESVKEIAPALVDTILTVVLEALRSLAENLPEMLVVVADLIIKLLDGLIEYIPPIVAGLVNLLCKIFDSLTEHIPRLLTSFMAFVGALFGEILKALDAASPDAVLKMIEFVGFISLLIIACSTLGSMIPAAMVGLVALGAFVAELSVILAAIGALNSIPGFQEMVGRGGNLLEAIGTALGQFVGGIIGGIAKGATSALPDIATDLSTFMTNLKPFLDGISSLDSGAVEAIKNLAAAILMLTAADILQGLTSFFTGKNAFEEFGKKLAEFAPYFKSFADSIKGVDTSAIETSSEAIVKLATTFNQDIFKTGGLKQLITGSISDLGDFGKKLAAAAPSFVEYSETIKGYDPQGPDSSSESIVKLAETFNQDVFRSGGLHQLLSGQTDLAEFAKGLVSFAPSVVSYSQIIKDVDTDVIEKSKVVCDTLTEIITNFPEKSLISRIFGFDTVSDFVKSLNTLGTGIATYYASISSVDATQMSAITQAIGELLDITSGNGDIAVSMKKNFGDNMYKTATEGVTQFLKGITDSFEKAMSNGSELMKKTADGLASKKEDLKTEIDKALDLALQSVKNIQNKFYMESQIIVLNMKNGAESQKADFVNVFKKMLDEIITIIEGKYRQFFTAGESIIQKITAGVKSKTFETKNEIKDLVDDMLSAINDKRENFRDAGQQAINKFIEGLKNFDISSVQNQMYNAGVNITDGIASGITSSIYKISNAIDSVSYEAIERLKTVLGIASPSKVMYGLGSYAGEGFVNGLSSWIGKAEVESDRMGQSVLSAVSEALSDSIQNDIDMDPVIRPVLDLTDVEEGSRKLNNMISTNKAVRAGAGMTSLSSSAAAVNSVNNSRNFGGFTFNIYTQSGNAEDIAKQIGVEVNRKIRQFSTI